MILLFNNQEQLIRVVKSDAIRVLEHTQALTDEQYVSDKLYTEIKALDDAILNEVEYMAIPVADETYQYHYFWVQSHTTEHDITTLQGVQAGIEELRKTPLYDERPTDRTLREALNQILKGTNWQTSYVADVGRRSIRLYYTDVFTALKRYCSLWNVEMQFFIEVTNESISARYIDFKKRIGVNNGARVVYGHNALQILKEEEKTELYTALIGRGKGEEVSDGSQSESGQAGYGRKINFADVQWRKADGDPVDKPLGQQYVEIPEATALYGIKGKPKFGFVKFSDEEDKRRLLELTYEELERLSRPQVTFKTSSVYVKGNIGDVIRVARPDKNMDYNIRIFEIKWDRITNRAVDIKLGDRLDESDSKRESRITNNAISGAVDEVTNNVSGLIDYVVSANGFNRNYYTSERPQDLGYDVKTNDQWYQPDPDSEGDYILSIWNGEIWEELIRTRGISEATRKVEELSKQADDFALELTATTELANNVSEKATQLEQSYQDVKESLEDGEVFKEEVIREFNSVTDRLSLIDGSEGYINEIRRDVGSLTSSITEYEEGTAKRFNVIESDVKGTKQLVSDLENETSTQFNVMSDEISAVVGKVNNIGGRNLIRNSNDMEWFSFADANVNVSDSSQLKNGQFVMATDGSHRVKTYQEFTDKTDTIEGETYTFSMTVYNGSLSPLTFILDGLDAPDQTVNYQETKRITFTGERDIYSLDLRVMTRETKDNAYFHAINPKLEKGEVATDWSPAPEDGVSKNELISEINIQADRQIFRVGDNRLMITEDTTYLDNSVIKSAHIADLAVTGAKIADASISSAKIISLDADQITGNTTNFIRSNWNNISTQISIDERGINVTGSDRWRRTYFNQTGFELFNGSGAYNKAGVIGYFKPNTDVADAYENVMQRGSSRHSIGIGVSESHDLTFGWTNTRANTQIHTPAMVFNSQNKRIELESSLNATRSKQGIVLNSEQHRGVFGIQLRWTENFRSRLVLGRNVYLEAQRAIEFYTQSGVRNFTMHTNNESWVNINMHGNSITDQSDERLKRNIMPSLKDSLGKFSKLEFKWFEYLENRGLADGLHHGVMAQDVLKFAPEWVVEDEHGYYSLNQSAMLMDAFKAIMQLSKKVKKLEAK